MRLKIVRYGFLMITLGLLVFSNVGAIDVVSLEILHVDWYYPEAFRITAVLSNAVMDPPSNGDTSWIALVDCQGAVIGFDVISYAMDGSHINPVIDTLPLASLNPITGRLVRAELYDTPYSLLYYSEEEIYGLLRNYPLLATASVDMGETYSECPLPEEVEPNPDVLPAFEDDRLNMDSGAPIVMYNVDGTFQIYKVSENSTGTIALAISAAELAALETPVVNTEIALSADGSIVVYKLSSGEIQVNTAPNSEGKVFVYILSADALTLISSDSYIA